MASNSHLLREVPLFANLDRGLLDRLADHCSRKTIAKDEILFLEGEVGDCLYIVVSGNLMIAKLTKGGDSHTLAIRKGGDLIGEMALIDSAPRSAQATAQTRCRLLVLHRRDFERFMLQEPSACLVVLRTLANRLRDLADVLVAERSLQLWQRLHSYLLQRADAEGFVYGHGNQTQIAELLGSTRESVCRSLADLEQRKLIERDGRLIRITRLGLSRT